MTLGIGVTTYNRRDVLARVLDGVLATTQPSVPIVVAWDGPALDDVEWFEEWRLGTDISVVYGPRQGVAANKNRAVRELMEHDVDWLVMVEDDVMPLRRGWADLLVAAADATGQACMTRAPAYAEWPQRMAEGERKRATVDLWHPAWMADDLGDWPASVDVVWNTWATATAQGIGRGAFERVGLYDESFGLYGHEHTEWQMRLQSARLVDVQGHPHVALEAMEPFLADLDVPPTYMAEFGPEWVEMINRNGGRLGQLARRHRQKYG